MGSESQKRDPEAPAIAPRDLLADIRRMIEGTRSAAAAAVNAALTMLY